MTARLMRINPLPRNVITVAGVDLFFLCLYVEHFHPDHRGEKQQTLERDWSYWSISGLPRSYKDELFLGNWASVLK